MADIQRANPRARRIALALVVGGVVVGTLLLLVVEQQRSEIQAWVRHDVRVRFRLAAVAMTLLLTAPVFPFAAYMFRFGLRTRRAGRYPPPGVRLVSDSVVVTGTAADRRGRVLQWLAVILVLAAAALIVFIWRLASALPLNSG